MTNEAPLITRYRPQTFEEMFGHGIAIKALRAAIKGTSRPHAFLFTGPSGVGKTTLARILAGHFKAELLELDAATNSGVDAARALSDEGELRPLSPKYENKFFLIDEAQSLSKQASQALLKLLEEPPGHLYLALCTTELNKIPVTVKSRCYNVVLHRLSDDVIRVLVDTVADIEKVKLTPEVMDIIVESATGQPRIALNHLQAVSAADSPEEARKLIAVATGSEPMILLCQHLLTERPSWGRVARLLAEIDGQDFEGLGVLAARYIGGAMTKAKSEASAQRAWRLLDALVCPVSTFDPKVQFLAAIGRCMEW